MNIVSFPLNSILIVVWHGVLRHSFDIICFIILVKGDILAYTYDECIKIMGRLLIVTTDKTTKK